MKKRVITGTCYVIVVVALMLLKVYVPHHYGDYGFDFLFWAISLIGTFEFLRAVQKVPLMQQSVAYALAFCAIPVFLIAGVKVLLYECAVVAFLYAILFVFDFKHTTLTGTAYSYLCSAYVTGLSVVCVAVNHMADNSIVAMLSLFLCIPLTDCFALFFGMMLGKKLPYKLAPDVSPNKTIIGGIGGLVGGILGGLVCFLLVFFVQHQQMWALLAIGLCESVFCQIGDLFESAVKRRCNIKDMGKLLPGHGGVLDRFDGTLFTSAIVLVLFSLI